MNYKKISAIALSTLTLLSSFGNIGYNGSAKAIAALSSTHFEEVKTINKPKDLTKVSKQVKNFVKKLKKNSDGSLSNRIIIRRMEMIEERLQVVIEDIQNAISSNDNAELFSAVESFSKLWAGASNYFQYFCTGNLDDTSGDGTMEESEAIESKNNNFEKFNSTCKDVQEIANSLFDPKKGIAKTLGDAYQYCERVRAEKTKFGFSLKKPDFKFLNLGNKTPIYSKGSIQKIITLLKSLKFHSSNILISDAEKEISMYIYIFVSNMANAIDCNEPADMLTCTIEHCNWFIDFTNSSPIKNREDIASVREFVARMLFKALEDKANLK